MKPTTNRIAIFTAVSAVLMSSVGCAGLPWRAKNEPIASADRFVNQELENIQYNRETTLEEDYGSPSPSRQVYSEPSPASYSDSGGSSGGGCGGGGCGGGGSSRSGGGSSCH
ncbi:hypothetical protein [Novipirellula artificiosorum]|uniref:Lipoprotein n=1 Tax=Novipirellula artificiosorum TaxID=2528016 RepID=A0A5C6DVJ1_9BACT|nr:hypothetical protein [Novipirellula artificiosorum]TWU39461.1 hypothetical protein Poly41_22850 [Novipirellula artificiosorum]